MRLPDFLIIGAMKAGTTSLYRDLLTNPDVFMPVTKEPNSLCDDRVLTDDGRREYAELFKRARPDQICGEASTAYTKRPDYEGVPARAYNLLGPALHIIYLVRHPIDRIISHHHHALSYGKTHFDINQAVRRQHMFVNYSRYAWQIEPWLNQFGHDRVQVVRFEDYIADRCRIISQLSSFLGITPRPELIDISSVHNRADSRRISRGWPAALRMTGLYRNFLRPLLPFAIREHARAWLFARAPDRPPPPSPDTLAWLADMLTPDAEALRHLLGPRAPHWDLHAVPGSPSERAATHPSPMRSHNQNRSRESLS